ncbi:MAG TPA: GxxExxY protein [Anaerolineales bacterium]|nr:GxxExxY protein [Anaerolineales bacterium]
MGTNSVRRAFAPISPDVERIGKAVLDAAFKVHTALGPGLLESVYETCTAFELTQSGLCAPTQVALPVTYQGIKMDAGLRPDMIVEECVIVEFKSVETMHPVFEAQLITYLKLMGIRLGFLINFNVVHLKDGIKRMVL